MSHNDFIRKLLNLKDNNIYFDQNWLSERKFKGVTAKVFHAKLTYTPDACYNCGVVFDHNIIKHGFKVSLIKLPENSGFNTSYLLKNKGIIANTVILHSP